MFTSYLLTFNYKPIVQIKGAVALADFNQLMAAPFDYHIIEKVYPKSWNFKNAVH